MSRNLLGDETSPYLLQHRLNPVHWHPWNEDAFTRAKAENKPVLLSIGYAACHWCHVMAHESFENEDTARLINENFVSIKVDREERPDIDAIYQAALALLGQQGGWPLTMFLTPDGAPFWGGTYYPPSPSFGRPAFSEVLLSVIEAYRHNLDQVAANADLLRTSLTDQMAPSSPCDIDPKTPDQVATAGAALVDLRYGGISGAPKFPQTPLFTLIWHAALRHHDEHLARTVLVTLDNMCDGGIYDHLGGGFSRYSTDETWLVPHFEKMLYDNAQLIELLTLVWQTTRTPLYAERVAETIAWADRDMSTASGAFAATLDADTEAGEGRYYAWTSDEISSVLPAELNLPFQTAYGLTSVEEWEKGLAILHRNHSKGHDGRISESDLAKARSILLDRRRQRVPPARDDKILADWNGLMIAAIANAGFVFDRPEWIDRARRAFIAVCDHLGGPGGRLGHSFRAGRRQPEAMLDDYADMARAALILAETTGDVSFISLAETWIATVESLYRDTAGGGYFLTARDIPHLIARTKSGYDAATPPGNGVMIEVLSRLFHLTGKTIYRQRAEETSSAFSAYLEGGHLGMATILNAWGYLVHATRIFVIGKDDDPRRDTVLRAIAGMSVPFRVLFTFSPRDSHPEEHPAAEMTAINDAPTVYICQGPTCSLPITDIDTLRRTLART